MKQKQRKLWQTLNFGRSNGLLLGLIALLLLSSIALAQVDSNLSWRTVDGGGGSSEGGGYRLVGTIGQADTGVAAGGGYTLAAGFWPHIATDEHNWVYLPLVMRAG